MAASETKSDEGVRWSRVFFVCVLVALLGEAVVRYGVERFVGRGFQSFDAYEFTGFGVYRQNADYTHPEFVNNQAGFRNLDEYAVEKPDGTYRVMALGASVLYSGSAVVRGGAAGRVHTEDTIAELLEPLLAERPEFGAYQNVEVINASINRAQLRHTMPWYVAELARYEPDMVLVFGTHNDTYRLGFEGGKDYLHYNPKKPKPEERRLELLANDSSLAGVGEKLVRACVNRSALAAAAYRGVDRVMYTLNGRGRAMTPKRSSSSAKVGLADLKATDAAIERYLATLGALLTYIELNGAKPVVFWEYLLLELEGIKPFSSYERDVADFLKSRDGGYTKDEIARFEYVRERVRAFLRARGTPLVDVRERIATHDGTVFNDYLHYSAEGNAWVAGVLADELPQIAFASADGP